MTLSYYAARANLSDLLQHHPDWSHAQFAAALGYSRAWVKKWRTRLREEQAAGLPLEQVWQGHSRARKTIYRVLKTHQRIPERGQPIHQPVERPKPMIAWQIDFTDVSSVPADPEGKRQHVVETLNIIDTGTSVLLDARGQIDRDAYENQTDQCCRSANFSDKEAFPANHLPQFPLIL